jgi:hypothetical protein
VAKKEYESDVVYVPDFELLLKDINRALETLRTISTDPEEVINDPKFGEIYNQFRVLRNNLRTHMRNKYPSEYQKIKGMFEMSGTGGGWSRVIFCWKVHNTLHHLHLD